MPNKQSNRKRQPSKTSARKAHGQQLPVWMWHPSVHSYYGEELWLFAFRFAPYERSRYEELKTLFRERGISNICAYEVFGEYDVLLRTWIRPSSVSYVDEITRKFPEISATVGFRATHVWHWCFPEDIKEREYMQTPGFFTSVYQIQDQQNVEKRKSNPAGKELIGHNLASCEQTMTEEGVKFYSAISFIAKGMEEKTNQDAVNSILREIYEEALVPRKNPIGSVSLYLGGLGAGFAYAVVKGVAKNTIEARDFVVNTVVSRLKAYRPIPTTFIVCERAPDESDDISRDALEYWEKGTPDAWVWSWFPELYSRKSSESMVKAIEAKLKLKETSSKLQSFVIPQEVAVLKSYLTGVAQSNPEVFFDILLPWFAKVEYDLKNESKWFRFLREVSGYEGEKLQEAELEIRTELRQRHEDTKGKEIPIGDLVDRYLLALRKYKPEIARRMEWKPAELTNIRNRVAHGWQLHELMKDWQNALDSLIWFLPFYYETILSFIKPQIEEQGATSDDLSDFHGNQRGQGSS